MTTLLQSEWFTKCDIRKLQAQLCKGDLLEFHRGPYSHWGIFEDWFEIEGEMHMCIIHRAAFPDESLQNSDVCCVKPEKFGAVQRGVLIKVLGNCKVRINNSRDIEYRPLPSEEILDRAYQKISAQESYHATTNNCEHLTNWCRYGEAASRQLEIAAVAAMGAGVVVTAIGVAACFLSDRSKKEKENKK